MISKEEIDAAVTGAMRSVLDILGSNGASSPGVLYHYTSAEGLRGILSSRALWMTDIRYMNDLSELQYATDRLASRLDARLAKGDLGAASKEFIESCRRNLGARGPGQSVFSVSFCEESNLLSQWRAYRGQGGGYALGIDFVHIIRLLDKPCVLRKIIYDQAVQDQMLDDALESFVSVVEQLDIEIPLDVDGRRAVGGVASVFSDSSQQLLFSFKHPGFAEEHEWRLTYAENNHPRYNRGTPVPEIRTFEGNIIPYRIVSLNPAIEASKDDAAGIRFPIVEVKVGPTINAGLNRQSISQALLGIAPDVDHYISDSGIPLRWL